MSKSTLPLFVPKLLHHYSFNYLSFAFTSVVRVLLIHYVLPCGYVYFYRSVQMLSSLQKKFHRILIPDMIGYGFSDKPVRMYFREDLKI